MKPEELQLGDIVATTPSGMPIKVVAIHRKKVAYHACNDRLSWVRIGLLQPIPITPEILKKNGFKFYCTEVFEEWKSKDKRITIHDEEYPNSFNKWAVHVRVDTKDVRTMGCFGITYVHELQHALRLCGINKEIEI